MGRDARLGHITGTRYGFNPRARVGRDSERSGYSPRRAGFNPRARVGRDRRSPPGAARREGFNPRARVGRDADLAVIFRAYVRFQSTRPRGARRKDSVATLDVCMFQSTRPRGARPYPQRLHAPALPGFNPRARVGRDPAPNASSRQRLPFQSTRPRGARHDLIASGNNLNGFNPRARVGRDWRHGAGP